MSNIVDRNKEIAKYYYETQKYFRSYILMCETVARHLQDKGYSITSWYKGKPLNIDMGDWTDRGCLLPKQYRVQFTSGDDAKKLSSYGFWIWFFGGDPSAELPWVPMGFLLKANRKGKEEWRWWEYINLIADIIRPIMCSPNEKSAYIIYKDNWPETINGAGDALESLEIILFSVSSINNSDELSVLLNKIVPLVDSGGASILNADKEYADKYLW